MSKDNKPTALDDFKEIRRILKDHNVDKQVCSIYFGYRTHSGGEMKIFGKIFGKKFGNTLQ